MLDRAKFFPAIRETVFTGHLSQPQVDGINVVLDAWEAPKAFSWLVSPMSPDIRWLGYMFGTDYHETAMTMQPIREMGGTAYLTRNYDVNGNNPSRARSMGNTNPGDGVKYCGKGFVQITWKNNYARMGKLLGFDLVNNPDLAMDPKIAVQIMFRGMTDPNPRNTFSGVNLQHYIYGQRGDWVGARHVINGTDHAEMIAETAEHFYNALK